jgi:hypothetical protein
MIDRILHAHRSEMTVGFFHYLGDIHGLDKVSENERSLL